MLYYLHSLRTLFSPLNVFQYITFRSAGAFLSALGVTFLIAPGIIRRLRGGGVVQTIRKDGPPQHHAKTGTPPMGGLIIYFALLASSL